MRHLRIFLVVLQVQAKISFSRNLFKFSVLIMPVFFSTLLYFIYGKTDNTSGSYIMFGSAIASLWGVACYSSAIEIERERISGTLETVGVTPVNFEFVIFSKIIANTILGLISFGITIIYSLLILQIPFSVYSYAQFILWFFVLLFSFISMSFLLATLFTLSGNAFAWMSTVQYPVYFLSGMLFPIKILPKWVQYISSVIPIRWSMEDLTRITSVTSNSFIIPNLISIILSLFYIGLAHYCFRIIEIRTRREGTLRGF
ncbi:MAG: ABC transporter permease [Athalassotoga sp.]|uniref:ABC transporter permease n=1 Tax=Athalassotoga sp. TaxID=2022597 RepID=UPI003CFBCE23